MAVAAYFKLLPPAIGRYCVTSTKLHTITIDENRFQKTIFTDRAALQPSHIQ